MLTDISQNWLFVDGVLKPGHQVASGLAVHSPYPQGTIAMQTPFFKALGLDLSGFYSGTLNVSIAPQKFTINQPEFTFRQVKWSPKHAPEDFSFCHCLVVFKRLNYPGLIYYPHPETKLAHFQDPHTLEVISLPIAGISYGDRLQLGLDPGSIKLTSVQ
jgi:hypothetical protein